MAADTPEATRLPRCCRRHRAWWFDCPKHATRVRGHHGSWGTGGEGCGSYDLLRSTDGTITCGGCGAGPLERSQHRV